MVFPLLFIFSPYWDGGKEVRNSGQWILSSTLHAVYNWRYGSEKREERQKAENWNFGRLAPNLYFLDFEWIIIVFR
jgi:hypothetical protein